jgi:broad specificity phosphatase PhoE
MQVWRSTGLMAGLALSTDAVAPSKIIRFLRHGQAAHNVNAERMKGEGCTYDEFLLAMEKDDAFDAPLTPHGIKQARDTATLPGALNAAPGIELVVSSPLSRAIDTADLVFPSLSESVPRVCIEDIREISGKLLNGKRRSTSELAALYPNWDFSDVPTQEEEQWEKWGSSLETSESTRQRAYNVMCWLWQRPETDIVVAGHGGIFKLLVNGHPLVETAGPGMQANFQNCELRSCRLSLSPGKECTSPLASLEDGGGQYFQLCLLEACTANADGERLPAPLDPAAAAATTSAEK